MCDKQANRRQANLSPTLTISWQSVYICPNRPTVSSPVTSSTRSPTSNILNTLGPSPLSFHVSRTPYISLSPGLYCGAVWSRAGLEETQGEESCLGWRGEGPCCPRGVTCRLPPCHPGLFWGLRLYRQLARHTNRGSLLEIERVWLTSRFCNA